MSAVRRVMATALAAAVVLGPAAAATASPGAPRNPLAPAGIGSGRVIVLRPHRADLVDNHVVVRAVPLPNGRVELSTVIRAIGDSRWASAGATTATLDAGLLQRPGTSLRVQAPIRLLRLVDSATSPAYLAGSNAIVDFQGVTVASVAGPSGASMTRPAAESPHRPYIRYAHATVYTNKSSFQALGSRAVAGHTGVTISSGSTLTSSNTTFGTSGIGLSVESAVKATLTDVTADGNGSAGIRLDGVHEATLTSVTATGNAIGVLVRGPIGDLRTQPLTVSGNAIGMDITGVTGGGGAAAADTTLGPVASDHNSVAGIILGTCRGCTLHGVTSTNDRTGIRLEAGSTGATVRDSTISGADTGIDVTAEHASVNGVDVSIGRTGTGIQVDRAATGAYITGGAVTGGTIGICIGAAGALVRGITVAGAATGVRIGAHTSGTTLAQAATSAASTGLDIDGSAGTITVDGFSSRQDGGTGIRSGAAAVTIDEPSIFGARVGLDLKGTAGIVGGSVLDTAEAVQVGANGHVHLTGVDLQAHVLGLRVSPSAEVTLTQTRVRAPLGARGRVIIGSGTSVPALPLRWLGLLALVALAFAAFLETLRRLRERSHDRSVTAPLHVRNIA